MPDAAPTPPVDEAAVRAEIATLRDAPYGVGESDTDRADKTAALWKKLYPPESDGTAAAPRASNALGEEVEPLTADPEIAKLTPSALQARIGAIRELLPKHNDGSPEHHLLMLDLEAAYRALYPESKVGDVATETAPEEKPAAPAPIALPALPPELSTREYDVEVLRELGAIVAASGTEDRFSLGDVLPMFAARGNAYLAEGRRPDPRETDAALDTLWGADADARIEAARAEMNRQLGALTPASRAKVRAYLDETGLSNDVALIEYFDERARARRAGARP